MTTALTTPKTLDSHGLDLSFELPKNATPKSFQARHHVCTITPFSAWQQQWPGKK